MKSANHLFLSASPLQTTRICSKVKYQLGTIMKLIFVVSSWLYYWYIDYHFQWQKEYLVIVEGKQEYDASYTSPNPIAHARVTKVTSDDFTMMTW